MNLERSLVFTLGFKVCDFFTSVSKTGSGDLWMTYILDKTGWWIKAKFLGQFFLYVLNFSSL
jgi:hypothetical protein